jgi:hypothetical protein
LSFDVRDLAVLGSSGRDELAGTSRVCNARVVFCDQGVVHLETAIEHVIEDRV